ncbi:MAG TPA: response regulator transcription factor [Thermoleophilaceae bacterium]|jgi:DNA-binding NarL/FixJ family response regulator|nr:response regulator transcription factor [Thermoleophilaceae bacterium]
MADRIRILICDDVALLRELLRYELEEDDGMVVVGEADNGLDGVRLVDELRPDVVVLDLAMPGIDGLEALTLIRQREHPPVVIIHSGFDASMMRERVLALGAAAYLEKGGDLREVRDAIRQLLDGRSG